jgi:hypothetical protein
MAGTGLREALRIFEIHPGQCGVLVYAADALAAAFVVSHPADFRALHPSLIEELYGELVHQYAHFGGPVPGFESRIRDTSRLRTLADLRAAARAQERQWAKDHDWHLGRTAEALGTSYPDLVRRIRDAGFASLLNEHGVAMTAGRG